MTIRHSQTLIFCICHSKAPFSSNIFLYNRNITNVLYFNILIFKENLLSLCLGRFTLSLKFSIAQMSNRYQTKQISHPVAQEANEKQNETLYMSSYKVHPRIR